MVSILGDAFLETVLRQDRRLQKQGCDCRMKVEIIWKFNSRLCILHQQWKWSCKKLWDHSWNFEWPTLALSSHALLALMPSVNQGLKWRAHQSLKSEVDSLLYEDTGVHTDCAKSCRLDFYIHVANALWFGNCVLVSRKPYCFTNVCDESDHFVFFEIHRANTHYNVEFERISVVGILAEQLPVSYTSERDDPLRWCRESYHFRSPNRDGRLLAGRQ